MVDYTRTESSIDIRLRVGPWETYHDSAFDGGPWGGLCKYQKLQNPKGPLIALVFQVSSQILDYNGFSHENLLSTRCSSWWRSLMNEDYRIAKIESSSVGQDRASRTALATLSRRLIGGLPSQSVLLVRYSRLVGPFPIVSTLEESHQLRSRDAGKTP